MTAPPASPARSWAAELAYALAFLGAHVGFMPLLVLLLPRRVELWEGAQSVSVLSWLLLAGALAASLSYAVAGAWSDRWLARHGSRRGLAVAGTALLFVAYLLLGAAKGVPMLAAGVIAFQLSLNIMFAPLGALLSDYIPNARKGAVSGMLNAALPMSYGVIALVTALFPTDADAAFWFTGALVALLVAPLLVWWPFGSTLAQAGGGTGRGYLSGAAMKRDFVLAWLSRLSVQLGAALVVGYLFLHVTGLTGRLGTPPSDSVSGFVGDLSLVALFASFIVALAGGHLSDRLGSRRFPLAVFALLAASGLIAMAWAPAWFWVMAAYALFNVGLAGFLSVDAALVAQLVSGHPRRGALLGLMNLTNTLPSIVVPSMTLLAVGEGSIGAVLPTMLLLTAAAAVLSAVLVMQIRLVR